MQFSQLAQTLQKLENTTKRLEIADILADLIARLDQEETDKAVYLLLGQLKAPFEAEKFNIAEKMMARVLEATFLPQSAKTNIGDLYRQHGDLGDVAYELTKDKTAAKNTIAQVYDDLLGLAQIAGSGSQEAKIKKASTLLKDLDKLSAKFVTRIILGTTRLGFTELTVIDALAKFLGDKLLKAKIEAAYSIHPDIGLIVKNIKHKGMKGINDIHIETGVPILVQKPQRIGSHQEALDKMKLVWAEFKLDGTRVQLHLDRKKPAANTNSDQTDLFGTKHGNFFIKTFTRNLEDTTHQYPDLVEAATKQIKADSAILDGEAIGYDKKTGNFLPFQETIQRKRKHNIAESAQNIPLKYFVFDLLYLNGESMINKPLRERKAALKKIISGGGGGVDDTAENTIVIADYLETADLTQLDNYYAISKSKKLEGLIVKKPDDPYQAGARSYSWIKLKRADEMLLEDSVECVVLGYYAGKGVRSKFGIGGFLAGVYDNNTQTFKTITKVGTGLTDEEWATLKKMCDKAKTPKRPINVEADKIYTPDVWVRPKIVVELGADEISESPTHSAGYALRFPRLIKFRNDKNPEDTTTVDEIKQTYTIKLWDQPKTKTRKLQ